MNGKGCTLPDTSTSRVDRVAEVHKTEKKKNTWKKSLELNDFLM
jgi:hypothetical protein